MHIRFFVRLTGFRIFFCAIVLVHVCSAHFSESCTAARAQGASFECDASGYWAQRDLEGVRLLLLSDDFMRTNGLSAVLRSAPNPRPMGSMADIPDSFDSREQWPGCNIDVIWDQGNCGSCWAFSTVFAMNARLNIASGCQKNVTISFQDVVSCSMADGCNGGFLDTPLRYLNRTGGISEVCRPYEIPPCSHPCSGPTPATPVCSGLCADGSGMEREYYVTLPYYVSTDEMNIRYEIMTHGPVAASFYVYEDFVSYKSGVYSHVSGSYLGGHAVTIIGWGMEGAKSYWLIANSWGVGWGDGGLFKILRGVNEVGIEQGIVAAHVSSSVLLIPGVLAFGLASVVLLL